jgi:hypothetical protein
MKNLVIFHDDLDGWTAAWLLRGLHRLEYDETQFLPYDYGETLPSTDLLLGRKAIYFLDLQFEDDVWRSYLTLNDTPIEIWDHHKLGDLVKYYYPGLHHHPRMSTTRQLWREYKKMCEPRIANGVGRLVDIVDAVDRHILGDKADFGCAVLEAAVLGIPRWKGVRARFHALDVQAQNLSASIYEFMSTGQQIFKWKSSEVERLLRNVHVVEMDGHHIPVVNTQSLVKEVVDALCIVQADIVGCYWYTGEVYEVRLRAQNDTINVVEIAQRYGGGGHGRSAGFRLKTLPWTEVPDGRCEKTNE